MATGCTLRLAPGWTKPGLVPPPGDRKITLWAKKRYVYRGPGENAKMCLTPFWRKRFRRSCQIRSGSGRILPGSGRILPGSGRILPGSGRIPPGFDRTAGTFFSKRALSTFWHFCPDLYKRNGFWPKACFSGRPAMAPDLVYSSQGPASDASPRPRHSSQPATRACTSPREGSPYALGRGYKKAFQSAEGGNAFLYPWPRA